MLDRHEANEGRAEAGQNPERLDPAGSRPLADREVPLPGSIAAANGAAVALNQWLDGDLTEADARRTGGKQVELWNLIAGETERRKRMVTPAYVAANIMAALPEKRVEAQTASSLAKSVSGENERGLSLNMAVAMGAGLFTLGLIVGKLIF